MNFLEFRRGCIAPGKERAVLGEVLHAWAKHHGEGAGSSVPLAVIIDKAAQTESTGGFNSTIEPVFPELNAAVRAAASSIGGSTSFKIDAVRFGQWCRMNKGRIVDGRFLANQPSKRGGAALWWVEKA